MVWHGTFNAGTGGSNPPAPTKYQIKENEMSKKKNTSSKGKSSKKVTSIGNGKYSRIMKKKANQKRGVSKYRGQGK